MNSRDLIDPPAQREADALYNVNNLVMVADDVRRMAVERADRADPGRSSRRPKNVLCLSGGGSYGAFTAGVLVGWTAAGTRPEFDVVTGISTGALIAPLAFLGPKYDADLKRFYTDVRTSDIYTSRPVRGLFIGALADNSPLAGRIDRSLTPELMAELAAEHRKGRRLYVGTTDLEGKRFVVWDLGAIAVRDGPAGRELVKRILLGSSAIPGFFPHSDIPVTVDGRQLVEKHGDGGVSQGLFFRPPYHPDAGVMANGTALAGTRVWCVVAGKLYADPAPLKTGALGIAGSSVSAVIYAQTRGDLLRIYTGCLLAGMEYRQTAIPEGFDAPKSATEFEPGPLTRLYGEGYQLAVGGRAWRSTPPGAGTGETVRERFGTTLTEERNGPAIDTRQPEAGGLTAPGPLAMPAMPGAATK
ncbi:MAG: patatin-like phospholipase family protein [Gemmataceae bacterium]|nr:patatin-like phospholipase family protein [Gemmataceae bacterium]